MDATGPTFHIKNFDKLQHYKDRAPPWIKLYNGLLDDYEFAALPDASKAHLLAIGLLASRYSNKIPLDAEWVGKRINATEPVNFAVLIKSGFVVPNQPCSNLLASCKQNARPERERETEKERERERETEKRALSRAMSADADVAAAVDAYNAACETTGWPKAMRLSKARKSKLGARLTEHGAQGWDAAIVRAAGSDFLTGRVPRSNGHEGWTPDLDWFVSEKNFNNITEGKYDNRAAAKKRNGHDAAFDAAAINLAQFRREEADHRGIDEAVPELPTTVSGRASGAEKPNFSGGFGGSKPGEDQIRLHSLPNKFGE